MGWMRGGTEWPAAAAPRTHALYTAVSSLRRQRPSCSWLQQRIATGSERGIHEGESLQRAHGMLRVRAQDAQGTHALKARGRPSWHESCRGLASHPSLETTQGAHSIKPDVLACIEGLCRAATHAHTNTQCGGAVRSMSAPAACSPAWPGRAWQGRPLQAVVAPPPGGGGGDPE